MAVVFANTEQQYQGLSSDVKPTGAGNGAIFHVVDTGEVYVFHDGVWTPDLRLTQSLKNIF